MNDLLDQSAIDALLAEAGDEVVEEQETTAEIFSRHRMPGDPVEVRPYDFKRPERVSKDQMRSLQTLHEGFARSFGASLSGYLRTIVEVQVATCEQMTYSEFISGLPNPTSFSLITSDGLEGQMCLEISPLIIYPIIDRLLGGTSQDLFIPQRPLTMIETRLIGNVTKRGLVALSDAWEGVRELTFEISASESNPQLVQIVPPNEVVVVIGFEIRMSNRAGTMTLCIPYNVIEPVMEELSAQTWFRARKDGEDPEISTRLNQNIGRATVRVAGVLAETSIRLSDLLSLEVGDIIETERPASSDVILTVAGERKFRCAVGKHRGNIALRVKRSVEVGERV